MAMMSAGDAAALVPRFSGGGGHRPNERLQVAPLGAKTAHTPPGYGAMYMDCRAALRPAVDGVVAASRSRDEWAHAERHRAPAQASNSRRARAAPPPSTKHTRAAAVRPITSEAAERAQRRVPAASHAGRMRARGGGGGGGVQKGRNTAPPLTKRTTAVFNAAWLQPASQRAGRLERLRRPETKAIQQR
uniref:Uncharacterized protein n=1 Tax=Plectus sambesii TaxID=2011161 RepID=A0A914WME1_9BILA